MTHPTKSHQTTAPVFIAPELRIKPRTRPSRGGTDAINPDDIIYGEYSNGDKYGEHIDLVYIDGEIIRVFSGRLIRPDKTFDELVILLRDDSKFYLVEIKEVERGFAFKRNDITDTRLNSVMQGTDSHPPSCVWTIKFETGQTKTVEASFQPYFVYGNTMRPRSMRNGDVLDKILRR